MREILGIHIGQGGIQVGNQCWELFCLEHGIDKDGSIPPDAVKLDEDHSFETFFTETSPTKFVPRTVFIDLEPSCCDEIRTGPYRDLYHQESIINGKEDAANNFARGKYHLGPEILDQVMHRITRITETCEGLQGFIVYHSFSGGTGSGFGALLMEKLTEEYNKKTKMLFNIFPSERLCNVTVEPYNSVFCTSSLSEYCDIAFLVDNQAMYDICINNLNLDRPKYPNINRLAAQVISNITCSLRFDSQLNCDLTQFQTNLVPLPKVIFPVCSFFPFLSAEKAFHEQFSVRELTTALFDSRNAMVKCNTDKGKYMACCIIYRGDVLPKDMNEAIKFVKDKKTVNFVDWCPTGFKVGINNAMPTTVPGSDIAKVQRNAVMMSNTTAFGQVMQRLDDRYDMLFSKRAFVFWYVGEGMEEGEFQEAREDLRVLEDVYGELSREAGGADGEEDEAEVAGDDVYQTRKDSQLCLDG